MCVETLRALKISSKVERNLRILERKLRLTIAEHVTKLSEGKHTDTDLHENQIQELINQDLSTIPMPPKPSDSSQLETYL